MKFASRLHYGNFTYAAHNLTASASYTMNLHFAETHRMATKLRTFDVSINGQAALSNSDFIAAAGVAKKTV